MVTYCVNLRVAVLSTWKSQARLAQATEMVGSIWLDLRLRGHARGGLSWLAGADTGAAWGGSPTPC